MKKLFTNLKVALTLLLLCGVCSAWGETYTISFNKGNTNGTNISSQLPATASTMCSSGSDYIASFSGDASYYSASGCGIRIAKSKGAGTFSVTLSDKIQQAKVKEVIIYASAVASGNTLDVTPAGSVVTKTNFSSLSTYSTSEDISEYAQSAISINGTLTSLSFGAASGKYVHLHQIDVITDDAPAPTDPTLSVSSATIDFGDVYQNVETEAKDLTITFANLATNDVIAAITGSTFSLSKTSSFTSGDKITITPKTAVVGEFSETLTVSATGVETKEVTITMNVVAAQTYNKVTDVKDLREGDIVVLGATSGDNSYANGNCESDLLEAVGANIVGEVLYAVNANEITLGKSENNWTLTTNDGTIGATAAKKISMTSGTTTWAISIDESGNASITSTNLTYGTIQFNYNNGNPRFLNYTSEQAAVQIYKKAVPPHTEAYSVTFYAGSNGSCSESSLTEDEPDAGVTLPTCTPNTGYEFVGWSTDEVPTSANAGVAGASYFPQEDCELYAYYAKKYTVTIETPTNGKLIVKNRNATISSGDSFVAGTSLTIEATPDEGYKFRNIQVVDNSTHTFTADNHQEYTLLASNTTIKANFDEIPTYTINYMVNGKNTNAQENIYEGTALVFPEVSSIGGKSFVGWSNTAIDGITDVQPEIVATASLTAIRNMTYYAVFAAEAEGEPVNKTSTLTIKTSTAPETPWTDSSTGVQWTYNNVTFNNGDIAGMPNGSSVSFALPANATATKLTISKTGNSWSTTNVNIALSGTSKTFNNEGSYTFTDADNKCGTYTLTATNQNSKVAYIKDIKIDFSVPNVTYSDYCTTIPMDVTISSVGYATACVPFAATISNEANDVKAYYVTIDGETATLNEITGTIPAETGVILKGAPGTVTFTETSVAATTDVTENCLVGTTKDGGADFTDGTEYEYYIFADDANYGLGFYKKVEGDVTHCAQYKAVLEVPAENAGAKSFFLFDETVGIENVNAAKAENSVMYNLAGQRVTTAKGIVIINGKKVIK